MQYDQNSNTLRIIDEGNGINLTDFMGQLNANQDNLTNGLRLAISSLLANKINLTFTSSLGTFTPIIHNKEGISQDLTSIFIAYEPTIVKSPKWFSIKAHNNQVDNQIKKGTQVVISPLDVNIVKNMKNSFSFLLPWAKKVNNNAGYLLEPSQDQVNNFFLNGLNLTCFNDQLNKDEKYLAYSYDANQTYFAKDLINNNLHKV